MREPTQVLEGGGYAQEVREVVIKSTLTGVAATVLAVTAVSPAGFGGFIGTSLASGFGAASDVAPTDDPYANLPAFPAPLTDSELDQIRGELARTSAALEITRAATEARIERVRAIAESGRAGSFAPVDAVIPAPTAVVAQTSAPAPLQPGLVPAGYTGGDGVADYEGSHTQLADLMFAHENF